MKRYEIGNGHTITIEAANRGIQDDYKITFYEDGRKITEEYGSAEYIKEEYEIEF